MSNDVSTGSKIVKKSVGEVGVRGEGKLGVRKKVRKKGKQMTVSGWNIFEKEGGIICTVLLTENYPTSPFPILERENPWI